MTRTCTCSPSASHTGSRISEWLRLLAPRRVEFRCAHLEQEIRGEHPDRRNDGEGHEPGCLAEARPCSREEAMEERGRELDARHAACGKEVPAQAHPPTADPPEQGGYSRSTAGPRRERERHDRRGKDAHKEHRPAKDGNGGGPDRNGHAPRAPG